MGRGWALEAARLDMAELANDGLDSRTLRTRLLRRLRRIIAFDSAWFALCDPATLMFTDALREEMSGESTARFVENEFLLDDYNKWVDLARAPVHARSLAEATDGSLAASYRFREILEPLGLGDELRVALVAGQACWGFICLHRELHGRAFNVDDASSLEVLAPTMAAGLRMALLHQAAAIGSDEAGVIVLGPGLSVVGMSATAESWLAEVSDADWPSMRELPPVVLGVAAQSRAEETARTGAATGARLRTRRGVWLTVRASRLSGDGAAGQTAVVLAPAASTELTAVIMEAYNLTQREREVTGLVLRGTSTKEISLALLISGETVQQHLKSIFDKTGVRSRRELAAQIFASQYQPRLRGGARVGPTGWFG